MSTMFQKNPALGEMPEMNGTANEGFFGQSADTREENIAGPMIDGNTYDFPNPSEEVDALAGAIQQEEATYVDHHGTIHIDGEANTENMTKVDGKTFGAPESEEDEIRHMADALYQNDTTYVDQYGRIHLNGGIEEDSNMTEVDGKVFGGFESEEDELRRVADALYNDVGDGYYVDEFGRICLDGGSVGTENKTKMDSGNFAAHEDQWYNKNPNLMQAEITVMRKRYPKAAYGYYKSYGNMYWIVTLQIFQNTGITKPWQFQIVYDKDHPHNKGFGGSMKVVPLKPSLEELKQIARQHGRPGVPHVVRVVENDHPFLKFYLCTRWPEDIANGKGVVASAAQAAAWAADWAAHFEIGIRDKKVWNKWCDDEHHRHLQVK